jgi:hypothetical protein
MKIPWIEVHPAQTSALFKRVPTTDLRRLCNGLTILQLFAIHISVANQFTGFTFKGMDSGPKREQTSPTSLRASVCLTLERNFQRVTVLMCPRNKTIT